MIDFLVIGGGIAGISAAARLSALGSVCVLEQEDALGYHASGRSAAMFEENYGSPSTCALSRASAEHHISNGYLTARGLMLLGKTSDKSDFDAACKELVMHPMTRSEAADMVPILDMDKIRMVAFHESARDLDADRLLQDFAKRARQNGAELRTRQTVTAITKTPAGWVVQANGTDCMARMILNAAGAWADQVAALAGIAPIGITPLRRSMARIPAPGELDVSGWPMIMGPREDWYAKPDAGKLLISPAEEDPQQPHDAWADDMVLAEGIARYEDHVTVPVTRLEHSWAGLRSFAPDRNLVLGHDAKDDSFIWVAGQGGYGMQTAPAASQWIADLVAGTPSELDETTRTALDPRRFS
ncbi:FAD-dependent oxidoreductase [Shimia sp. SDUM112013]|uniref:NAD(P)/FAD-dependent oxidoreductase n=1 Tax=Shimia sp. SDUM112013 TaxID=3136160 RepID=UPI0032EB276A